VDTSGVIQKEMAQKYQQRLGGHFTGQHYFYIGDFGNNAPETEKTYILRLKKNRLQVIF
jgi:hypothetical protein